MSALLKYQAEITDTNISVRQSSVRKKLVVHPEINASGEQVFITDIVYEPIVQTVLTVPALSAQDTQKLTAAFQAAGIPVTSYDEIRNVLMNLPHMKD